MSVTPKVAASTGSAAVTGSLSSIAIWVLVEKCHIEIPADIASAMTTVITALFGFAGGYFAPRSEPTEAQVTQILSDNASRQPENLKP
jgi:hypothetical protein